jgi:hypothetical protein
VSETIGVMGVHQDVIRGGISFHSAFRSTAPYDGIKRGILRCISCLLLPFKGKTFPVIHHQLLDGRVFRTFGTHFARSGTCYPLKNAMMSSFRPKFPEIPRCVPIS